MQYERPRSVSINFVLGLYAGLFSSTFLVYQLGMMRAPDEFGTKFAVVVSAGLALCTLWAVLAKSITDGATRSIAAMYMSFACLNGLATVAFGVGVGTGTGVILTSIFGVIMMFMIVLRDA